MAAANDHLVGEVLDGRYEILAYIGGGGQATVYKAKDRHVDRLVAVKVMRNDSDDPEEFARRFDAEARAIAKLSDANVVSVFDQGSDRDRRYIVMEYVEGTTLKAIMSRQGPMPVDRALPILEAVVSGLAAAHRLGIVHRDMKPENVLISHRGLVKVADFGLASHLEVPNMTVGTTIMASITYASPERLRHTSPVDFRSDVYAVGIITFEMLTGTKPFPGDAEAVLAAHLTDDVPAPSTVVGRQIPAWLDVLAASCGRRQMEDRPADAIDLLERLRFGMAARREKREDDPALIAAMSAPSGFRPVGAVGATGIAAPSPSLGAHQPAAIETTAGLPPASGGPAPVEQPNERVPRPPDAPNFQARRIFVALLAAVVLLACTLGVWWLASGRYARMPDIIDQTAANAGTIVSNAGLTLVTEQAFSETVATGLVISSDPPAGSKVLRGHTVHAVISQGPERYAVPKLAGLSLADAQAALATAHLTTGKVTQQYSNTVPSGQVISASVSAGTKVKPNTTIDLVVSKGPTPITVVDYTGKLASDAMDGLTKLGLTPQQVLDFSATVPVGYVISQTPNSGTLFKGDTVTLTVSQGPQMVTIPAGLVGMNADDAKASLEALGLKPVFRFLTIEVLRQNIVASSSPPSGTSVQGGSEVTLWIR